MTAAAPGSPPRRGRRRGPTGDRVREAAYNLIGPVDDAAVLDLFAGSGAMGLEALSRGARRCVFVESDRAACAVIRDNLEKLRLTGALVLEQGRLPGAARGAGGGARLRSRARRPAVRRLARSSSHASPRRCRRCSRRTGCSSSRRRRGSSRSFRSPSSRAAATVRHALPCSRDDHRYLPRLVRPGHPRPPRRDRPGRRDLRPRRRRRRPRPAPQADAVHRRGARRVPRGGARRPSTTSPSTSSTSSSSTSRASTTRRRWSRACA